MHIRKRVVSAASVLICCFAFLLSAQKETATVKCEFFPVAADTTVMEAESVFSEEAEPTEEGIVIQEKIAIPPEYEFNKTNETMYLLADTETKTTPYDEGETGISLARFSNIQITGKNSLKYWEANIDGQTTYIDSSLLTSDTRYVFTTVEKTKYANDDIAIKSEPYTESDTIATISFNQPITVIGENNEEYSMVNINGTEGYVKKSNLMDSQKTAYNVSQSQLETIWAIVMQEAGANYEGALAVMSSAINRVNSPRWSYLGDSVYEQLTAPGQYCYSIDNYWQKYLGGNVPDVVKQAVADGLQGKTNHSYTCFRSTSGGDSSRVNIGGNWFFGN